LILESTLAELTTAGISTVSTILEWLLLLLSQDRSSQAKARRDVLGNGSENYLQACIQETFRLKTPLFVPRRCMKDFEVQGWTIPEGAIIMPNSYALAHDESLWNGGPADQFRPERFLGMEKPLLNQMPGAKPRCPFSGSESGATAYKFLPFGAGARFCQGLP